MDELLELAITGAQRVKQISTKLLRQVRTDERPHEVELGESVALALQLLADEAPCGPKLVSHLPTGEPLRIHAEPAALNQVWINLIDNAIEPAGPSGEVRIELQRVDGRVQVDIADTGPGIPPHHQGGWQGDGLGPFNRS